MTDTAPLLTLAGIVIGSLLTYLGLRRQVGTVATTAREQLAVDEEAEREKRIDAQVDAFISNQNQELVALRAANIATSLRMDVFSQDLLKARQDILECQRDRFDLQMQAATLNVENKALHDRVTKLEAQLATP